MSSPGKRGNLMATTEQTAPETEQSQNTNQEPNPTSEETQGNESQPTAEELRQDYLQSRSPEWMARVGEWIGETWAKLRGGHEAIMLQDANKVLKQDRQTTENYRQGMLTDPEGVPLGSQPQSSQNGTGGAVGLNPLAGLEDMVNLGEVKIEFPQLPQPQQQPQVVVQPSQPQPQPEPPKKSSWLKKGLVGAALVGAGIAVPYVAPLLPRVYSWLTQPEEQQQSPPVKDTDTDTDTTYDFRLHPPKD